MRTLDTGHKTIAGVVYRALYILRPLKTTGNVHGLKYRDRLAKARFSREPGRYGLLNVQRAYPERKTLSLVCVYEIMKCLNATSDEFVYRLVMEGQQR